MKGIKEAFIDAGEISQMLGIGMTKAYAIIKEYNAELEAKGYFTMRGKCPRKYFEQKIYGYEDYYNPDYEPQRNRSKVAEEMDYEVAVGASVISEQDEVNIPPETNEMPEDGAEIAENVISDADAMTKQGKVKLVFIEAKKTKLTLRDLGQLWAYCKLVDPEEAFLLTSADLGSLRKLIAGFKREDLLDFGNGKIIKKMKIGRWEVIKDRPDLSSFLPKI